ncbi:LamG domain-containing protein [Candidatus Poribacteria bacterium]|jgi:hypothetical protein|nr:LamG domain-containing protein [Candidatus Poribacteria bacterium]MBT5533299.1 LamG domain-containing protein [Candidatus Poribacteria bacterium]MBT5710520.1 LamG domain-containing protein [Candidatus Poribacteria bacterium]MBT7101647.1 LamG domain-containing protein [Candidatus Poribacteria bacterium]MBT7805252.1 LamG domain-containing protein [Candidatus Poribacteria bacterium]
MRNALTAGCAVSMMLAVVVCAGAATIDEGLLVYLTFDKVSGDTVEDMSGGGHDGFLNGGATVIQDEVKVGSGALRIEGGENQLEVQTFAALETYEDNTFLFWINFPEAASGGWDQILAKPAPGSDRSPGLWVHTGGLGIHYRYEPGNTGFSAFGPDGDNSNFEQNQWYHVAGVTSGGELMGYVDGVEKATAAVPPAFTQGDGGLYVGNSPAYAGPAANFIMDDLAVYSRVLTPAEIGTVMDGDFLAVDARGRLTTTWAAIRR